MDERVDALSLILFGCTLAQQLQNLDLQNVIQYQPHVLSAQCEEIVRTFKKAVALIDSCWPFNPHSVLGEVRQWQQHNSCSSRTEELLWVGNSQPMGLLHALGSVAEEPPKLDFWARPVGMVPELGLGAGAHSGINVRSGEEESFPWPPSGGEVVDMEQDGSNTARRSVITGGTPLQRSRKDGREKQKVKVYAPLSQGGELVPADQYIWRKYGQKPIHNCRFPRSYFRCANKNLNGCYATKQVQRCDPFTIEVTYIGRHTCLWAACAARVGLATVGTPQPQASNSDSYSQEFEADQNAPNAPTDAHVLHFQPSCTEQLSSVPLAARAIC